MKVFLTTLFLICLAAAGFAGCYSPPDRLPCDCPDCPEIVPDDIETGEAPGDDGGLPPGGVPDPGTGAAGNSGSGDDPDTGTDPGHDTEPTPDPDDGSDTDNDDDGDADTGAGGDGGGDADTGAGGDGGTGSDPGTDNGCGLDKTVICHIPPGNPEGAMTLCVGPEAADAHLEHGDHLGECVEGGSDEPGGEPGDDEPGDGEPNDDGDDPGPIPDDPVCETGQVMVCHSGHSGIPGNSHVICVSPKAAEVHVAHGDYYGPCR